MAIISIFQNRNQARKDWLHAQQLATEERQYQSRPILVPMEELAPATFTVKEQGSETVTLVGIHTADGLVNWNYPHRVKLELRNMGGGVALNVHCILYGAESLHRLQFISWDNGPIAKDECIKISCEHGVSVAIGQKPTLKGVAHFSEQKETAYTAV